MNAIELTPVEWVQAARAIALGYPAATQNFERLRDSGLEHLTAEAIVLDYPHLFSEQAIAVAEKRLRRESWQFLTSK